MADRDNLAQVDDEDLDAVTLFTYLKLTGHIPSTVFFTAELTFESNMVVLNRHIMQHRQERERDVKLKEYNQKSFLTVKGRISGFSDYAVVERIESPPIIGNSLGRQQSFMQSFSKSMKEGVMSVRSGGMGSFLRPTFNKDNNNNSENSSGQYSGMDNSQTSVKEKSKSRSNLSQKRGNHQNTVLAVIETEVNETKSNTHRPHNSLLHSAHSSAKSTPRQHHSAINPLLRQVGNGMSQLPETLSPRTPRSTTSNVDNEIGPAVEVHELPAYASGRAFVPGK